MKYLSRSSMERVKLSQIKSLLNFDELTRLIKQAFCEQEDDHYFLAPIVHMPFQNGEGHIKSGYDRNSPYYVIKIATGFSENRARGLSNSQGCIIVGCQQTGTILAVLEDEGYLTDLRTAVAGRVVFEQFARPSLTQILVVGTGIQAQFQLQLIKSHLKNTKVLIYGRNAEHANKLVADLNSDGFNAVVCKQMNQVIQECQYIITTTPSNHPLVHANKISPGTHICAIGADAIGKQELDLNLVANADLLIADHIQQSLSQGEFQHAYQQGYIKDNIISLGTALKMNIKPQMNEISITDLTGVAIQDIVVAEYIMKKIIR